MKKTLYFYFMLIFCPIQVLSQSTDQFSIETDINEIQKTYKQENNLDYATDTVLEQLLSIPFEQRQYIYPALFENPSLPKKIKTHPEIAIWEGKLPTKIAPEKKEFAEKYLKDLNPQLYIFLSPKGDNLQEQKDQPLKLNSGETIFKPKLRPKIVGQVKGYPSLNQVLKQPKELELNPEKGILSLDNLQKLKQSLIIFKDYFNQLNNIDDEDFKAQYNALKFYTDKYEEKVNPFQIKLQQLKLLNKTEELDSLLKKEGWKSANEFAVFADATAKAYRAARAPLVMIIETKRYRNMNIKTDLDKMIVKGSRIYEALPADIRLVQNNLEKVRNSFINSGFQSILNAEMIDAIRK